MSGDDCIRVIAAIAAAQVAMLAALAKLYIAVTSNAKRIDSLHEKAGLLA